MKIKYLDVTVTFKTILKLLIFNLAIFFAICQSSNSQITWTETKGPIGYGTYNLLFIDDNPLVAVNRPNNTGNQGDIRQSLFGTYDKGFTWNNYDIKSDSLFCIRFFINQNIIHALASRSFRSFENFFFKSFDYGKTWIYDFKIRDSISYFNNLFIAKDSTKYLSTDKGGMRYDPISDKWIKISNNIHAVDSVENIFSSNYDTLLVSKDKGLTWEKIEYSFGQIERVFIDKNNRMYIHNTSGKIYANTSNGLSWKNIIDTLYIDEHSYSIIDSNNILLYLGNKNWYKISNSNYDLKKLNTPILDYNLHIHLYASNNKFFIANENGYFESTDYGETWSEKITGPNGFACEHLCANDNMVLTNHFDVNYFTSDYGENWSKVLDDPIDIIWGVYSPQYISSKSIIYVWFYGDGVDASVCSNDSLKSLKGMGLNAAFLAYIETSKKRIYAQNWFDGLYYSDDHMTWTYVSHKTRIIGNNLSIDKNDNIYCFASSPNDSIFIYKWNPYTDYFNKKYLDSKIADQYGRLIVGQPDHLVFMRDSAIFKSSDDGDTWEEITNKFPKLKFNKLITDDAYNFWVATSKGVFSSSDGGNTWAAYNDGLKDLNIAFLANSRKGFLYLAPSIGKIYKSNIFLSTKDEIKTDINPITISPNPATDFIDLFVGAGSKPALTSDVRVFDIFGQIVSTPVCSADTPASGGQVRIDVSGLVPGMYFVRIGDKVQKFIKY